MSSRLHVPAWLRSRLERADWLNVLHPDGPTAVGVSGGRSSAMLWVLAHLAAKEGGFEPPQGFFQNTGEEHEETLTFVWRLRSRLSLTALEFWPPEYWGQQPMFSRWRVIEDVGAFSRKGEPFDLFLLTLAEYRRKEKGLPPTAPWARMRICTAYMKVRTQMNYLKRGMGWDVWESWVGLRADEPKRVSQMERGEWKAGGGTRAAPLAELGITKADVYRFWAEQPFDLGFGEFEDRTKGNCTMCFLKDEADLVRAMDEDPEGADRWIERQAYFGNFKPRGRPTYSMLREEAPMRRMAETALDSGTPIQPRDFDEYSTPAWWTRRRFANVLKQEERRYRDGPEGFACHCEAGGGLSDDDVLRASPRQASLF